jgi:hypothetical protein
MNRLESSLESSFQTEAAKSRFISLKLKALSRAGFPDRTVLGVGQHIFFVELKREGEPPRLNQRFWHRLLKRMGFRIYVIDSKEKIAKVFKYERDLASS